MLSVQYKFWDLSYKYMFLCQNLDLFNVSIVHVYVRMSALLLPLISPLLGNFLAQPYFSFWCLSYVFTGNQRKQG
ncbi:hypothetical protein Hdeb2414_s0009g00315541 [Helianthus debilis subsp. tardiflorus]